jgi:hypothetical protein
MINALFRSMISKLVIPQFGNCQIKNGRMFMMGEPGTMISFPVPCNVDCIFEFYYLFDIYKIIGRFPSIQIVDDGKMIKIDSIRVPAQNESIDDTLNRTFKEFDDDFAIRTKINERDAELIKSCKTFVSRDEMRQAMKGIFVSDNQCAATDAHRLRWCKVETEMKAIIPVKFVDVLRPCSVVHDASHCLITYEEFDMQLQFPAIQAKYPDYRSVIPNDNHIKVSIDRNKIIQCIRKSIIVANKTTYQVRLVFSYSSKTCDIVSEDLDFNVFFKEQIEDVKMEVDTFPEFKDEMTTIAFNAKFMLEILKSEKTQDVIMQFKRENKPIVVDGSMLLMPIMTNY